MMFARFSQIIAILIIQSWITTALPSLTIKAEAATPGLKVPGVIANKMALGTQMERKASSGGDAVADEVEQATGKALQKVFKLKEEDILSGVDNGVNNLLTINDHVISKGEELARRLSKSKSDLVQGVVADVPSFQNSLSSKLNLPPVMKYRTEAASKFVDLLMRNLEAGQRYYRNEDDMISELGKFIRQQSNRFRPNNFF